MSSCILASIDQVFQLWRRIAEEMSVDYPDVAFNQMYVDNAAMQLIINPKQFDVIVAGNMFGDILSDEASAIGGSIGMMPSASIGGLVGLYEPVHGSAPDIAGKGIANPIATLWSVQMMMEFLNQTDAAAALMDAIEAVTGAGFFTPDLGGSATTVAFTDRVLECL